jgi:hypothetical protein
MTIKVYQHDSGSLDLGCTPPKGATHAVLKGGFGLKVIALPGHPDSLCKYTNNAQSKVMGNTNKGLVRGWKHDKTEIEIVFVDEEGAKLLPQAKTASSPIEAKLASVEDLSELFNS